MQYVRPQARESPDISVLPLPPAVRQATKIPEMRPRCVVMSGHRSIAVTSQRRPTPRAEMTFGDAFDLIDEITEQSVDLVLTSVE